MVYAAQERGLAGAARPQQHYHLAAPHVQRDAAQHFDAPEALVGVDHLHPRRPPIIDITRENSVSGCSRWPTASARSSSAWATLKIVVNARYQIAATTSNS